MDSWLKHYILPTIAHWDLCKGSLEQNQEYLNKVGPNEDLNVFELGHPNGLTPGKRTDIHNLCNCKSRKEAWTKFPAEAMKYPGCDRILQFYEHENYIQWRS